MTKLKIFLPILLFTMNGFSQEEPKEIVDKFFKDYQEKNISVALDNLYSSSKWILRNADAVTNLKSQMEGLNADYVGEFYGYDLMVEKKVTDNFLHLSYMVKFERQPIRYTFQFYKPKDKWIIYSFKYDGNIANEIEEASKLYYFDLTN